jgi:hypothetical protein
MSEKNSRKGANLRPPTSEEARARGRAGGLASARKRQALKSFKDALKDGLTPAEQDVMLKALKRNASRGNLPSLEFLLKMIGEHPDQLGDGVDHSIHITIDGADDYAD